MKCAIFAVFLLFAAAKAEYHSHEMVDLNCQEFYGHNDRCHQIKAHFCDHASWRLNFFTVWMHDFLHYRSQQGLPDVDMPDCNDYQVMCQDETMKMCHTAPNDCQICYCADHQYENMEQLDSVWRQDYQKWNHVQQEWRQLFQNQHHEHPEEC